MQTANKKLNKTDDKKTSKPHPIFKPFKQFGIPFPNRLLCTPFVENQADKKGMVTQNLVRHYLSLVEQGIGTVMIESAYISRQGRSHFNQLGISDEEHLEGLEKLVRTLKKEGAAIGVNLSHAGAKTSRMVCGEQPVGPSEINFGRDYDISREFDQGDYEEITLNFVHAAERAEEVGMDFFEINGADQLLLDQCFSTKFNTRDDEYGVDTLENRLRLPLEIVRAIHERDSISIPMVFQFSIQDKLEDGFSAEDLEGMISLLEKSGVDIFHPQPAHILNRCFNSDESLLEWIAKHTRKPMIAEGNIKSPQVLKDVASLKLSDWFVMERSIYARPQWFQFLNRKLQS